MIDLITWGTHFGIPPTALPVALVCATVGSLILSSYTRWRGWTMIVVNALVLFIGASLGNLLTAGMRFPLDRYYVRPIVMSFAGMAAISIILLLLFPRGRNS